jgi:citrate synthase
LRLRDNRTGKVYEISLKEGKDCFYIHSKDLAKITNTREEPLRIYDPGYKNTISCTSRISYIDGIRGVLEYRGYRIEQLAERSSFLEVAFLLIFGELPSGEQLAEFTQKVLSHTAVHTDALNLMRSFRYDAHPMGVLISAISAYATLYPEAAPKPGE